MFVRGGVVIEKVGFSVAAALAAVAVALAVLSASVRMPYTIGVGAIVVMLAVLAWIGWGRGRVGLARAGRGTRIVRVGGYVGLCALVLVVVCVLRFKDGADTPAVAHPRVSDFSQTAEDVQLSLMFVGVVALYAAILTAMTWRRSRLSPRSQTVGTVIAVVAGLVLCALVPLGSILHPGDGRVLVAYRAALVLLAVVAPLAAGAVAGKHAREDGRGWWRGGLHAAAAGLIAAAAVALVLTVVTLASILIFSGHVTPMADAGPFGPAAAIRRTVGSATAVLLFVVMSAAPLVGVLAGAAGGAVTTRAVPAGGHASVHGGIA
jgi:hypothetical protein